MASAICRQVGEEFLIVPISGNIAKTSKLFSTNVVGATIWNCLSDDPHMTAAQIASIIASKFELGDTSESTLIRDIEEFSESLTVAGINPLCDN